MNVLITGATGLLRRYLLHELQEFGEQIRVLVLPAENVDTLLAQGVEVMRNARRELGYEPKVDLLECIELAAGWFNAGGMTQSSVTRAPALKG